MTGDPTPVPIVVGPVSAASARTWAEASRRTLETVKARPDLGVPADVVDAFEGYLDLWEPAMSGEVFTWMGEVDPDTLRHLAAHWARLVTLARDDSEGSIAPADPEGQEFYDALAQGFAEGLAAADATSAEQFAPRFEAVVPDFVADRTAAEAAPARRVRVLLVDDHPDIRLLVRIGLEADGRFDIVGEAADGQEAIDRLDPVGEGGCVDAVLLDLAMPVMGGMEALPLILKRCPTTRVVVFSANDEPKNRREAAGLGAVGFLPKGAAIADIAAALHPTGG